MAFQPMSHRALAVSVAVLMSVLTGPAVPAAAQSSGGTAGSITAVDSERNTIGVPYTVGGPLCNRQWQLHHTMDGFVNNRWEMQKGGAVVFLASPSVCTCPAGSIPSTECHNGTKINQDTLRDGWSAQRRDHWWVAAAPLVAWCRCVQCPYSNRCLPDGTCVEGTVGEGCSACSSGTPPSNIITNCTHSVGNHGERLTACDHSDNGRQSRVSQRYYNIGGRCFQCSDNYAWDVLWSCSGTVAFMFVLYRIAEFVPKRSSAIRLLTIYFSVWDLIASTHQPAKTAAIRDRISNAGVVAVIVVVRSYSTICKSCS